MSSSNNRLSRAELTHVKYEWVYLKARESRGDRCDMDRACERSNQTAQIVPSGVAREEARPSKGRSALYRTKESSRRRVSGPTLKVACLSGAKRCLRIATFHSRPRSHHKECAVRRAGRSVAHSGFSPDPAGLLPDAHVYRADRTDAERASRLHHRGNRAGRFN